MTPVKAILHGVRTVNSAKRLVVLLWLALLLLAALAAQPLAGAISNSLAHSKWAQELIRGLDPSWITETIGASRGYVNPSLPGTLGIAFLFALVAHLLVAGGAISVFAADDRRYTAARFFEGCGRYFWRFFRLLIYALIPLGAIFALNSLLNLAQEKLWKDGMVETPLFYATRARVALLLFLLILLGMVVDYARVRLVVEPGRSAIRAFHWSARFVARHFWKCFSIWILLIGLGALFFLAYDLLARLSSAAGASGVFLLLVVQQLYIASRLWLRLTLWSSQTEMYFGLKPLPAPASLPAEVLTWPPESEPLIASGPAPNQFPAEEEAGGPA